MLKVSFVVRVYLLALVARLIPMLMLADLGIGLDDMFQYDMLARSLAQGNGFRWYAREDLKTLEPYIDFDLASAENYDPTIGVSTSFRAPLYPLFLSVVYFFSGLGTTRFLWARIVQAALLGAPLAPLTYKVAPLLFAGSEKRSRAAAYVVAFYPLLLLYPLGLGTENLFFLLLLAFVYVILSSLPHPNFVNMLLAGILLGLTSLTRSVILLFAGCIIFYLLFEIRWRSLPLVAGFMLVITPWVVRNSILHGHPVGIETSMGYNLYLGYHPDGNGSFIFGPSLDLLSIMDDYERDLEGTRKAVEFVRSDPTRFIPLAFNRLGFFFGLEKRILMYFYSNNFLGYIPPPLLILMTLILILPFAIICLLAVSTLPFLTRSPSLDIILMLFLAYLLPHVLILSEERFHLALVPYLAIFAVQAWGKWMNPALPGKPGFRKTMVAAGLALLLVVNWGIEFWRDYDKIVQLLGPQGNQAYFNY
ncbi:MAG: hypothetical protein FJZ87_06250 [Chloroflexi bacterium]|nr:hypothetical protein [Chloroflexota bacterium]